MTRSHCAGVAAGGQSCDPSLGAALCLHFLQTETHHSPPSPIPHPLKYNPSKEFVQTQQHPSIHVLSLRSLDPPKTRPPAPPRKTIHKGKSQTQSQKGCILHTFICSRFERLGDHWVTYWRPILSYILVKKIAKLFFSSPFVKFSLFSTASSMSTWLIIIPSPSSF